MSLFDEKTPDQTGNEQEKPSPSQRSSNRYEIGQQSIGHLDMYNVWMDEATMEFSLERGRERYAWATSVGAKDNFGEGEDSVRSHEVGFVVESAVRILFHKDPTNVPLRERRAKVDIPPDIAVKGTPKRDGRLWVRKRDADHHLCVGGRWWVSAKADRPRVTVWGWILAAEAKEGPKENPGEWGEAWPVNMWRLNNLTPLLEERRGPNRKTS